MSVTEHDVLAIAHLARLALSPAALPAITQDLSTILHLFTALQQVDTTDCLPMAHPLDVHQRLRADVVTESNQLTALMHNAPAHEAGLFLVPKVIEEA